MAKGAGHARARTGHDARRDHHGCRRRRPATSTACCVRATATTFDRVDSDGCMSTNDTVVLLASGASGVAGRSRPPRGCRDRGLRVARPPARRRRRGRPPRHRGRGALRGIRRRRARGGPRGRPQQPVQVRRLRQRPQLGPGARRGGHDRGGVRPGIPRRLDERRAGLPGRRRGGGPLAGRPQPPARCTSSSTSTPATPPRRSGPTTSPTTTCTRTPPTPPETDETEEGLTR